MADQSTRREIQVLFSNQRVVLRETSRAVTPFGGGSLRNISSTHEEDSIGFDPAG